MIGGRIVFVTFELYPLTAGGIGRALYNIVKSVPKEDFERITILIVGDFIQKPQIPYELRGLDVIFADQNDEGGLTDGEATFPPRWAFDNTEWHWRSYVALRALRELSKQQRISYIEFPDWGGLGYCTTQEKRLGLGFASTLIALRLHGPHGVLLCTERYAVSQTDLNIFDIERKALRDCDLIIAQTRPYFDKVREVFGFSHEEWERRYFYSPLPVKLDHSFDTGWSPECGEKRVLFTSKFQHIKRPEIFVRGVAEFLSTGEGLGWEAIFCAHVTDAGSRRRVESRIPEKLKQRFLFEANLRGSDRDHLIAHSVVVVSSACESFCLSAFEASLLGGLVVVNGTNPSFGEGTLWQDGVNCLKFDGTAHGLAQALERAAKLRSKLAPVDIPEFKRPWAAKRTAAGRRRTGAGLSRVSVVVYGSGSAQRIARTIRNVAASRYSDIELVVTLAGEGDGERDLLQRQINTAKNPNIKVVANEADGSVGASLNRALEACSSDRVVLVRAGDLIHTSFIGRVSSAFDGDESIDAVTCHNGFFDPSSLPDMHQASSSASYRVVVGEAVAGGAFVNRDGSGVIAIRRAATGDGLFDEELLDGFCWGLRRRLLSQGCRIASFNAVYAFCDVTAPLEIGVQRDEVTKVLDYHSMLQTTSPANLREGSIHLLMSLAKCSAVRGSEALREQDHLYGSVDLDGSADLDAFHSLLDKSNLRDAVSFRGRSILPGRWFKSRSNYQVLRRSGGFDEVWYVEQYPDVASSGIDPLKHYLIYGGLEGRFPNRYFDSGRYLVANPDVREARMNPLLHYILHGRKEGRPIR